MYHKVIITTLFNSFHWLLIAGWVLYACIHSVMAAVWFKNMVQRHMGKYIKYYRLLYSCVAAITLLFLLVFQFSHSSSRLFNPSLPLIVAGVLFAMAGFGIMLSCVKKYFLNLSGVDVLLKQQREPVLEQRGLHGYVRHPLYSGTLLFVWSLFFLFPLFSNLIACVMITIYTLIGIHMEEQKLVIQFGDAYKIYARKTPMLLPFLWKKLLK